MQPATSKYAQAIVAGYRRILPQAIIDIVDPDVIYDPVTAKGQSRYSQPERIHSKEFATPKYWATLEPGRWRLNGTAHIYPDDPNAVAEKTGFIGNCIGGSDGVFAIPPFIQLNLRNLQILQACSVHFTGLAMDGVGRDFTVEIFSGTHLAYQTQITGNQEISVFIDGFTAQNVTALRLTITKWSMPGRVARVLEIVPGIYEVWDGDTIYSIDVLQETSLSAMSTPYGSCTMSVHNKNKRFNPYNKSGLFRSIQERQGIAVAMGVQTESGQDFLPLGIYYQKSGGWETDAYGLTITFKLVDIVGLLVDLDFMFPPTLPTTLGGWLGAITAHLGTAFAERWATDPGLDGIALTAEADALKGSKCGTLLRYLAMASQACIRADNQTGKLLVFRPDAKTGVLLDQDNMPGYPKNTPTDDIADITFRLANPERTEYVVKGATGADKSMNISNPFIHTTVQADAASTFILSFYGTTQFVATSRGDMRSELGDLDTVDTGFGNTATGRRYKQQFKLANGIMKSVPSHLLEVVL